MRGAFCPVIALLRGYDADWIDEAAKRGVYAYIVDTRPEELQSAIEITLRRFAELQDAQGAFERRNAEILQDAAVTQSRGEACSSSTTAWCRHSPPRSSRSISTGRTNRERPCSSPS